MTLSDKLRKRRITLDGGGLSEIMIKFNAMLAINIAIVYNWPSSNLASTACIIRQRYDGMSFGSTLCISLSIHIILSY